jgi:hypothetical protein
MNWGRFEVYRWDNAAAVGARLSGWHQWVTWLADRVRGSRRGKNGHTEPEESGPEARNKPDRAVLRG